MARRPDTPFVLRLLMALVRGFAYVLSRPMRGEYRHPAARGRREPNASRTRTLQYDVQAPGAHHIADSGLPLGNQQASAEPLAPQGPETTSQDSAHALPQVAESDAAEASDTAAVGQVAEEVNTETEPRSPNPPGSTLEAPEPETLPPTLTDERDETSALPVTAQSTDDLLRDYIAKFCALRRTWGPQAWPADTLNMSPHKPVLLLAVLSLIADGTIANNVVTFDEPLLSRFDAYWRRLMGDGRAGRACYPLFHLRSEGFWHLQPIVSSESDHGIREVHSMAELRRVYSGAYFDEELFALLQDSAARTTLRDALLNAHFTEGAAHRLTDVPDASLAAGESREGAADEDAAANRTCGTAAPGPSAGNTGEPSPGDNDQADGEAPIPEGDAPAPAETVDGGPDVGIDPDMAVPEADEADAFEEGDDVSDDDRPEGASDAETATEEGVTPPAEPASEPDPGAATAGEDHGTPLQCTIHVEVFVASRVLARRNPTFSRRELAQTIRSLFGDTRPGVVSYVRSSRCVANRPFSAHAWGWTSADCPCIMKASVLLKRLRTGTCVLR